MPDRIITVRLDEPTRVRLEELVTTAGTTRSDVMRDLITGNRDTGYTWLAFYGDESAVVPFDNETAALRYAVDNQMMVIRVPNGISLGDAIRAREDARRSRG